jgi:Ser/Thr protein kinase RdoA (MazF antagonist)
MLADGVILGDVLAQFGKALRGEPQLLTGGLDNRNVRVRTDDGDMVVRQYLLSPPDKVAAELDLVHSLAREGYPTPAPLVTIRGGLFIRAEHPIALFPFVAGHVPPAVNIDLAVQYGNLLASLHQLSAGWTDLRIPRIDRVGLLRQGAQAPLNMGGVEEWRAVVNAFLQSRRAELASVNALPSGPLHHDLHRHNVLVDNRRIVAVLDFDELNHGPLLVDIARAWHYLAADSDGRALPRALADALVTGYDSVRPLLRAERANLDFAFDLVNLVEAATFLMDWSDTFQVNHVSECNSLQMYLRNADHGLA